MLGGVIILIIFTDLTLGLLVVALVETAQVQACSTSVVIGLEAVRIVRSAPCFLPGSCEATLQI